MDIYKIPMTIEPTIASKDTDGFYRLIDDPKKKKHYQVKNRSAPILQQIHQTSVPGIRAVSDTLVFVPEDSLTQKNVQTFAQQAAYLDRHRLGTADSRTLNEVIALEAQQGKQDCVRIDPCPAPPFKDLKCCTPEDAPDVALQPKQAVFRPPFPIRDYNFKDSTWNFMVDRPYDRYAMYIMAASVAAAILAVLVLLIWAILTGG